MSPASPARFFRSELRLLFGRRRNQMLLAILALVPVLIAIAVKVRNRGGGGSIFGGVIDNGLFAPLAALLVTGPVFLPLVVSVVAGEAVAGEANAGTLRYLLAVPVGRTRLLGVKFAALVVWCVVGVFEVTIVGLAVGFALFPTGRVTLLSGTTVSLGEGVHRLVIAACYVALGALTVAAIGLFVSTMSEVPIATIATTVSVVVASEVADAVPQLASLHHWLPTHYWLRWADLLRDPMITSGVRSGFWSALAYIALFGSLAWARFGGKDVTS